MKTKGTESVKRKNLVANNTAWSVNQNGVKNPLSDGSTKRVSDLQRRYLILILHYRQDVIRNFKYTSIRILVQEIYFL